MSKIAQIGEENEEALGRARKIPTFSRLRSSKLCGAQFAKSSDRDLTEEANYINSLIFSITEPHMSTFAVFTWRQLASFANLLSFLFTQSFLSLGRDNFVTSQNRSEYKTKCRRLGDSLIAHASLLTFPTLGKS